MKYLYCPSCKQLHVKPWFSINNRCQGCLGYASVIRIPNNWMTYTSYLLYVLIPGFVVVYFTTHDKTYLYTAVALLLVMMVVTFADIVRGEKYARERVKVTVTDAGMLRKRNF